METKEQTYHHGNVKNELVACAMRLMEAENLENISLRRLAREIGVTPAAVYNHFGSKQELMRAIKSKAFNEMHEYLNDYCKDHENPEKAFEEICQAYIDFSRDHPTLFDLLFNVRILPDDSDSIIAEAADHKPDRLAIIIKRLYEKYGIPVSEERLIRSTILIWSQLHGLIVLSNSGVIAIAVSQSDWSEEGSVTDYIDVADLLKQYTTGFYRTLKQHSLALQNAANQSNAR